jgi:flagellar biosynthesis component FlhA
VGVQADLLTQFNQNHLKTNNNIKWPNNNTCLSSINNLNSTNNQEDINRMLMVNNSLREITCKVMRGLREKVVVLVYVPADFLTGF